MTKKVFVTLVFVMTAICAPLITASLANSDPGHAKFSIKADADVLKSPIPENNQTGVLIAAAKKDTPNKVKTTRILKPALIKYCTITGRVWDKSNKAVKNARVDAHSVFTGTNSSGTFKFENFPTTSDTVKIRIQKRGLITRFITINLNENKSTLN